MIEDHVGKAHREVDLEPVEQHELAEMVRPRAAFIYEIVRREGERELGRPFGSLFWAGFTAGLSISLSLVAEAALVAFLPTADWTPLVHSAGYSVGFLVVVLGRQQLFTENTITAVVPVLARPGGVTAMLRLWSIVLAANVLGTVLVGALLATVHAFPERIDQAMLEVARHFFELDAGQMFVRGIVAGWLIATMVWLMPASEGAEFAVVLVTTYLIALTDLSHVVAGSVEAAFLVTHGEVGLGTAVVTFFLPTLAGNVLGGSALFTLLTYAQVREEMTEAQR